MEFPIFKTKIKDQDKEFNLSDPAERKEYFELKAGPEIRKLKNYFEKGNTFIAYLLGKKNTGKGTYSKLFKEIIGADYISHISIGDVVRNVHEKMSDEKERQELIAFLEENYRGFMPIEECLEALINRDTKTLLPTEFILALTKREISRLPKKTLFIDGFPRELDQISYSLYFRDLIGYRTDPDMFILINVPNAVIDERIKNRVICPKCHAPASIKLGRTKKIEYEDGKFYLICDDPKCGGPRMIAKEGDELGIEAIKGRLGIDEKLIKKAFSLYGIPKIFLRNAIPADQAEDYVDKYEITPEYVYSWNAEKKEVEVAEKPWTINDDQGQLSYSLLPSPVVLSMIKQMVEVLKL